MALQLLANLPLGRYQPGGSWLHRLDPRLKLVGLPVLIMAGFALSRWTPLITLILLGAGLAAVSGIPGRQWGRLVWSLRYLFLFTLVLHSLLSPGHTLLGQAWLSQDGLLLGARVCLQLLPALLLSGLLILTTAPADLAAAAVGVLSPLQRLGLPVRRWADNLLLVLALLPLVQEEAARLADQSRVFPTRPRGLEARLQQGGAVLAELLRAVVGHGDGLAHALARGELIVPRSATLPSWTRLPVRDWLTALGLGAVLVLLGWLQTCAFV